jgi:hypothetical protein
MDGWADGWMDGWADGGNSRTSDVSLTEERRRAFRPAWRRYFDERVSDGSVAAPYALSREYSVEEAQIPALEWFYEGGGRIIPLLQSTVTMFNIVACVQICP